MILEVGVGEGRFIDKIIKKGSIYVGVDISRRILNYAKETLEKNGRDSITHLLVADAEFLPFRDKMFESCFCISTLFFIPDQYKAIREMGRTVKKHLVVDFRNSLSPALIKHRLKIRLIRLKNEIMLKVMYVSLKSPIRKLADIRYGMERVNRAVVNLKQYFDESGKSGKQELYFPMQPYSITRAFESANLQILNVVGFDLPEYSDKSIPYCSIIKWLKPTLIIKARPMQAF